MKHHYVPQCYLRQWTGADEMLCEYQRWNGQLKTRRVHTSGTGYLENLYTLVGLPPEDVDIIETEFFLRLDQEASDALDVLLSGGLLMTERLRSGWSRFLMSLMNRHPGRMAELMASARQEFKTHSETFREKYPDLRSPGDPMSYDEYCALNDERHEAILFARHFSRICDMGDAGTYLNNMVHAIFTLSDTTKRFITSDNPLFINKGLSFDDCHITLPISPTKLFVATKSEAVMQHITQTMFGDALIEKVNELSIMRAYRFVYAACENKTEFVDKYWPKIKPTSHAHLVLPPDFDPANPPSK